MDLMTKSDLVTQLVLLVVEILCEFCSAI